MCMYICLHIYIYPQIYVYTFFFIWLHKEVGSHCGSLRALILVFAEALICSQSLHQYIYIHICIYRYMCIYIYVCIYLCIMYIYIICIKKPYNVVNPMKQPAPEAPWSKQCTSLDAAGSADRTVILWSLESFTSVPWAAKWRCQGIFLGEWMVNGWRMDGEWMVSDGEWSG